MNVGPQGGGQLTIMGLPPQHPLEGIVRHEGLCRGASPRVFLEPRHRRDAQEAMDTCARCPVFAECREVVDYVESASDLSRYTTRYCAGIWAGETPGERCSRRRRESAGVAA